MKPILENLAIEYEGRLNVVIIDVYDEPELGSKYGIIAMPTQILFDSLGREVSRHPGFFPKAGIIAELKKVGI
jgi:thioredoxin 1